MAHTTWETEISKCAKCGKCRSVCPVFIETGNESTVARGRISLADALRNGEIFYTERLRDYLLSCKKCLRCSAICPSSVEYDLIIQTMLDDLAHNVGIWFIPRMIFKLFLPRRWLFDILLRTAGAFQRLVPLKRRGVMRHLPFMLMGGRWIPPLAKKTVLQKYRAMDSFTSKSHIRRFFSPRRRQNTKISLAHPPPNPLQRGTSRNMATLKFLDMNGHSPQPVHTNQVLDRGGEKRFQGKVGFYVGCLINYVYTDIADAVIEVLGRLGVEVVVPAGQVCCGIPARSLGDTKTARKLAETNVKVFEDANVDFIVNACATCGRTLKRDYLQILGDRALKFTGMIYDVSEFIEKYLHYETRRTGAKVTYHDPCHLYWGQNVSKQPRDILRRSSEFLEMDAPERCCGGGGVFNLLHYDISMKIGDYKAKAIEKSGAEVVATGCPGCQLQIEDLLAARGSTIKCTHTIQVLRDAMLSPTQKPQP